jgi:hypothetical protein
MPLACFLMINLFKLLSKIELMLNYGGGISPNDFNIGNVSLHF